MTEERTVIGLCQQFCSRCNGKAEGFALPVLENNKAYKTVVQTGMFSIRLRSGMIMFYD